MDDIEEGESDHPADSPPELGEDAIIWKWYVSNCTGFAKEFNLMSSLIDSLKLNGSDKQLFLIKLDLIHASFAKIRMIEQQKRAR